MKITCDRKALARGFSFAASVVPSRSPKPILMSVMMEAREDGTTILSASNLEISVAVPVPGVTVDRPGYCLLRADRVAAVLGATADDTLVIEAGDNEPTVTLRGLRSEFHLSMDDPDLYPAVPAGVEGERVEVRAGDLLRAVRRTVYATDPENSRYALGGLHVEPTDDGLILVGTDGRRLSHSMVPISDALPTSWAAADGHPVPMRPVVPVAAWKLAMRLLADCEDDDPVSFAYDARSARLLIGGATIATNLVSGRFPEWRQVIPPTIGARVYPFAAGDLRRSVEQAAITTTQESSAILFQFADGSLCLSSTASDVGSSRVDLPLLAGTGTDSLTVSLTPRYVTDVLRSLGDEAEVEVRVIDAKNAVRIDAGPGFGAIVMPLTQ
jgi:DNA polymerase-3 subunit beta